MHLYSRGNARKSLTDTIAFRALSQVSTILGYVVLVRALSEKSFGVLSLLYAIIPVVGTIASLGLEQVLRRFQPEYLRAGNLTAAAWLVKTVSLWRLLTSVVVLVIILLAWNVVAPIFKLADHRTTFAMFCLLVVLSFQLSILQLALASHMLHRFSVGSTALLSIIKLLCYGTLYLLQRLTLESAIVVDTVACGVAFLSMQWAYSRNCLPATPQSRYRPTPQERRRLLRYGLYNNFNEAGVLLMYSTLDNFFIAAFMNTVSVGVYAFYTRLRLMFASVMPVKQLENVVQPLFFSIPVSEAARKLPQYFSFLLNMELLLQWPALAFTFAYHSEIVQLVFAGKFIEYSWLLPTLFAFGIVNTIADPVTLVAQYEERPGVILASKLFIIYNLIAMAVLVPTLGVLGAVLASGTAQLMKNLFIWWHVRHRAVWNNAWQSLTISVLLWGAAGAVCLVCKQLIAAPALVQMLLGIVVLTGTALIYFRSPAMSASDRAILAALAGERQTAILRRVGLLEAPAT